LITELLLLLLLILVLLVIQILKRLGWFVCFATMSAVWWDMESVPPPTHSLLEHTLAFHRAGNLGFFGVQAPVIVHAYGPVQALSEVVYDAVTTSGISLVHSRASARYENDNNMKGMMVDILIWALDHPPPANIYLISGLQNDSFKDVLHQLHIRRYNIWGAEIFPANVFLPLFSTQSIKLNGEPTNPKCPPTWLPPSPRPPTNTQTSSKRVNQKNTTGRGRARVPISTTPPGVSVATEGEVKAWLEEFAMSERGYLGMSLGSVGKEFQNQRHKKLDHKALGFVTLKHLLISFPFSAVVRIEHPRTGVYIMLAAANGDAAKRKKPKVGTQLETLTETELKHVQSRTATATPIFSDWPSSSKSTSFDAEGRKTLQHGLH
jgi:hypothetical protein